MFFNKKPRVLQVGGFKLSWLQGGFFHLDGGTMFGPVPKVLWQKKYPVDSDNLIPMCNDPLLVRTGDTNVLIDTGIGNKLTKKQLEIYKVTASWNIPGQLEDLGISRHEINMVILTHCDFDHAGGILMHIDRDNTELSFPNATYFIHQSEWQDVNSPNSRSQSTYLPENFDLLKTSGKLELTGNEMTICPGIRTYHTGGHTRGHQVVEITSQDELVIHLGDLCPTLAHLNPLWVMAYDNFPLDVIDRKKELFRRYIKRNSWFTFYHDPFIRACKLASNKTITTRWSDNPESSHS
jgi:glyoxylase-like metal-dependent hydrolase (beta-lactamase superfamily II)